MSSSSATYRIVHRVLPPLLKLAWRPTVVGIENVPRTGGVILASNHLSFTDSVVIGAVSPRPVHFLAKSEYFTTAGVRGRLMRMWFEGLGMMPVDRDDPQAALASLSVALEVVRRGQAFGIYPEGTRSRDGRLYRGRTGIARIALTTKAPVIPVAVIGTNVVAPPGKVFGRYHRPTVIFGEPLDFSRYDGMENDRFILRAVTDEIMYAILQLSGQEYVDLYASDAKKRDQQRDDRAA